tara:strand:- start:71616 stop:73118 length:1503 start_codon:yes stop_codon:yes gene_type:complete
MKYIVIALLLVPLMVVAEEKSTTTAVSSIPEALYARDLSGDNSMTLLEDGMTSFQARLDLINSAGKDDRVAVEYFIYELDDAGRLLNQALARASERGADVKILVDRSAFGTFKFNRFVAAEAKTYGIETKYYNSSGIFFSTAQFRNHRKMFLVGGKVITGGRNVANEYFGMDKDFNFDDRDILLEGPIVDKVYESFMAFWNDERSSIAKDPVKPTLRGKDQNAKSKLRAYKRGIKKASRFFKETESDLELLKSIESKTRHRFNELTTHQCYDIVFVSDSPGAQFSERKEASYRDDFKHLRKELYKRVMDVDDRLLISTPYFIQNKRTEGVINRVLSRDEDITVEVFTNSLATTDHMIMSAALYKSLKDTLDQGVKMYLHSGDQTEDVALLDRAQSSIFGVHSKSHVYDEDEIFIGTYNIDNRSDFYNAEMGIFCKGNRELTAELESSMRAQMEKSLDVIDSKTALDSEGNVISSKGNVTLGKRSKLFFYYLPAWLIEFLL